MLGEQNSLQDWFTLSMFSPVSKVGSPFSELSYRLLPWGCIPWARKSSPLTSTVLRVKHFTIYTDGSCLKNPIGMSLLSWLHSTWLCLVVSSLGLFGRKQPKANLFFNSGTHSYGMAVTKLLIYNSKSNFEICLARLTAALPRTIESWFPRTLTVLIWVVQQVSHPRSFSRRAADLKGLLALNTVNGSEAVSGKCPDITWFFRANASEVIRLLSGLLVIPKARHTCRSIILENRADIPTGYLRNARRRNWSRLMDWEACFIFGCKSSILPRKLIFLCLLESCLANSHAMHAPFEYPSNLISPVGQASSRVFIWQVTNSSIVLAWTWPEASVAGSKP